MIIKFNFFVVYFIFLSNFIYPMENNWEFVNPNPPFCQQNREKGYLCGSTSCSMLIRYWAVDPQKIVQDLGCSEYQEIFKNIFENERALSTQMTYGLKIVGTKYQNSDKKNYYFQCEEKYLDLSAFFDIRYHLKYSEKKDELSPWDRPGILYYPTGKKIQRGKKTEIKGHAVLCWGCKKEEDSYKTFYCYKVKDGESIPIDQNWGRNSIIKYQAYPSNSGLLEDAGFFPIWYAKCLPID